MDGFSVAVDHMDGTVLLRPSGELDIATAPTLEAVLDSVVGTHRAVAVDLSGLSFADCAGLRPIRRAVLDDAEGPSRLWLFAARPAVERVLVAVGLQQPVPASH